MLRLNLTVLVLNLMVILNLMITEIHKVKKITSRIMKKILIIMMPLHHHHL
jgi:hypothetical protein